MIYWRGKYYPLVEAAYNGAVYGYLCGGQVCTKPPSHSKPFGYIQTPSGVVVICKRDKRPFFVGVVVLLLTVIYLLYPRVEYSYYQVAFEESPVWENNTLYCNVVNVAEREVSVQFVGENQVSIVYYLEPGDTLPTVQISFIPTAIRYGGSYDFSLEVQYD